MTNIEVAPVTAVIPAYSEVLWRSLRERFKVRTLAALAVSLLGRGVHRSLVRLKRRTGLPGLRGGSG